MGRVNNANTFTFFSPKQTRPIDGSIKIGEELSLVIYLRDPNGAYDLAVRDCWAYDDSMVDVESTLRVQLTTTDGCAR